MELLADQILVKENPLKIDVEEQTATVVGINNTVSGNLFLLSVLNVFSQPKTLKEGIQSLQALCVDRKQWIGITAMIYQLYQAGILHTPGQESSPIELQESIINTYDLQQSQIWMMQDQGRMNALISSIKELTKPGDVVVEIGTGIGVNAIVAVQSGASHVYAIELSAIGQEAIAMFEANGVSENITYYQGDSRFINLPTVADVLIADISGANPFSLYPYNIIQDAKKRFLKPEAICIPNQLSVYAIPVEMPESGLSEIIFTPTRLSLWKEWYGMNFDSLLGYRQEIPDHIFLSANKTRNWPTLSDPIHLATCDLLNGQNFDTAGNAAQAINREGYISSILLYLHIMYSPNIALSNRPSSDDRFICWQYSTFVWKKAMKVKPLDKFTIHYILNDGDCMLDLKLQGNENA